MILSERIASYLAAFSKKMSILKKILLLDFEAVSAP